MLINKDYILIFCAILLIYCIYKFYISWKAKKNPYTNSKDLFSQGEIRFLNNLDIACEQIGNLRVFGKARIADLVDVSKELNKKKYWHYFSKISQKHVDYVIVNSITFETVAVVELDDSSHEDRNRARADLWKNYVFTSVGLPMIRFKPTRVYDPIAISTELKKHID